MATTNTEGGEGEEKRMVRVESSDGVVYEVVKEAAMLSVTLKNNIEDVGALDVIPVPNVTGDVLRWVVDYCKTRVDPVKPRPDWDTKLAAALDMDTLHDVILAASYLEIQSLLDLTCQRVADIIKGKTPAEIRKTFNLNYDFTKEDEEEMKKENTWAFA